MNRLVAVAAILIFVSLTGAQEPADIRLRRPIGLALVDDGKRLLVANRDSGTITVLDTDKRRVLVETRVAGKLAAVAGAPSGRIVAATPDAELLVLSYTDGAIGERQRVSTGVSPVSVQVDEAGKQAVVACLWPRRLVVHDLAAARAPILVDLPFAPGQQLFIPQAAKLIVADAFGGQLAVVDARHWQLESVRSLPIHNIRGLTLDRLGKHLLLTHQTLNSHAHTTTNDILTGSLMSNHLRKLSLSDVLAAGADIQRNERLYSLGDVERGAGDPAAVADSQDGSVVVAFAGVNEVAVGRPEEVLWTRLAVGRRPTALAVDAARRRAYVANTFADSISVIDLQGPKVVAEIPLGAAVHDLRPHERGEMLFFDARLSFESWLSCHSCHTDGHTSGRLNDNLSDGSFGTPKRILTLLGVKDTGPWAWSGQMPDLATQVRSSIKSTMQGPTASDQQVNDLVAYLQTLTPPPAVSQARGSVAPDAVRRGRHVFAVHKCATCHAAPSYTSAKTYDVGLRDELGGNHFNPPSLRGVSQGGPYFHDGRAQSLEEVFTRYRHQLSGALPAEELRDLLAYLRSL